MDLLASDQRTTFYAHSLPDRTEVDWEPLEKHLESVADLAAGFAEVFKARQWGWILGRCHDLGKYSRAFQQYICGFKGADAGTEDTSSGRVDHSTFGARYVIEKVGKYQGQLLAFGIAGHHAGLPDASSEEDSEQRSTLQFRLHSKTIPVVRCPEVKFNAERPIIPIRRDGDLGFQLAFFGRMLFSCLIDADRLATEEFCNPEVAGKRSQARPQLPELKGALDQYLAQKQSRGSATRVNQVRAEVLSHCRRAAIASPGFFSLNVPTGGGKTLSSMAFALDHCLQNDFRRIVVAIPFTSIIEQNADVYRDAFGDLAHSGVVEHHTNLRPERETRANQLGTENWDAPVVVTTNVQLFESLFASATTPCRKLHRLAGSVIVLDEAQTIPVDLLRPALAALRELVLNYRCSVVLCTATQPALEKRHDFEIGIDNVHHIIPDPRTIFQSLRRVEVQYVGRVPSEELVSRLSDESSALCIVNTRAEAAKIFEMLDEVVQEPSTCFHLSTWMCGQHRRETLKEIRRCLDLRKSCRVVSTQLVEAGVDLDFAAVYRAITGFDSIAQAAGRCNREGLLEIGRVFVFESETAVPAGLPRDAAQRAQELIAQYRDPISPEAIAAYFQLFYWSRKHTWDKWEVMAALSADGTEKLLPLRFRLAASRFKMIRDEQIPILIPYDENSCIMRDELLKDADFCIPQRRLQPYLVSVHAPFLRALQKNNLIIEHTCGVWLLMNSAAYSSKKGISAEAFGIDPSLLII